MSRLRYFFMNCSSVFRFLFFFFNDTATTEIYTLSLHDALPISSAAVREQDQPTGAGRPGECSLDHARTGRDRNLPLMGGDRKSTRLNSSHSQISYAVFCLKKKKHKIYRRKLAHLEESASSTNHI